MWCAVGGGGGGGGGVREPEVGWGGGGCRGVHWPFAINYFYIQED